jgi:hypothetical protein
MKISNQKFAIINLSFTFLLVVFFTVIAYFQNGIWIFYIIPPILVGLLSQLGFYFLNKAVKKEKNNEFIHLVMISTFIRLIIGILANVLVILLWKSQSMTFVLSYFFSYFFLTIFEIYAVMFNLRANSKDKN